MIVQELLGAKNSDVVTVRPSTPLVEAAQALATHRIGALVVTDDAGRLSGIISERDLIRTGSGRQAACMAPFKWVNTMLGNIKCAITGTYRKLGPDHAGRYLASFAWRYNRRYQLETMIPRFVHSAARTEPMPYRLLIAG